MIGSGGHEWHMKKGINKITSMNNTEIWMDDNVHSQYTIDMMFRMTYSVNVS